MAIQQAVPLRAEAGRKRKRLAIYTIGTLCLAVLLYNLPGNTNQKPSEAPLPTPTIAVAPTETPALVEAKTEAGDFEKFLEEERRRATAKPKPKQTEETFYITDTGKRYHRASCRHLRYSAHPVTRSEAEDQGYTPCRVCYP